MHHSHLAASILTLATVAPIATTQPSAPGPQSAALPFPHPIITEVLYAVPTGERGDANGDGVRQTSGDEFIELVNPHDRPINLKGYRLRDAAGLNPSEKGLGKLDFAFPACELAPGQIAVVFNGFDSTWQGPIGDRTAAPKAGNDRFANALVFSMKVGSSKTGLANKGDLILLSAPDGTPIHAVSWGDKGEPDKNGKGVVPPKETLLIERAPVTSGKGVERRGLSAADGFAESTGDSPFSPGSFKGAGLATLAAKPAPTTPATPASGDPKPQATPTAPAASPNLMPTISEVLINVPPRADADKDGRTDATGEQFVELVNPHAEAIELKGITIEAGRGSTPLWHCDLPSITLKPGEVVVIFNQATQPDRKFPDSANDPKPSDAKKPETDAKPRPNPRFANAYVLAATGEGGKAVAMTPAQGWITLNSAAGLVIESAWWGTPPAPENGTKALTAETIEQITLDPDKPASVRKRPASGDFEPHPNQGGVVFSPGRSEFKKP